MKGPGGGAQKHPADYMLVYEFKANGKIAYEWAVGGKGLALICNAELVPRRANERSASSRWSRVATTHFVAGQA